jgi:hypothetical protein
MNTIHEEKLKNEEILVFGSTYRLLQPLKSPIFLKEFRYLRPIPQVLQRGSRVRAVL